MNKYLDNDDFPTREALEIIKTWEINHFKDYVKLFEFIKNIWSQLEGRWEEKLDGSFKEYYIFTGRWLPNARIIKALQKNVNWDYFWRQSTWDGYHIFSHRI
jgi:hypothetical protein